MIIQVMEANGTMRVEVTIGTSQFIAAPVQALYLSAVRRGGPGEGPTRMTTVELVEAIQYVRQRREAREGGHD